MLKFKTIFRKQISVNYEIPLATLLAEMSIERTPSIPGLNLHGYPSGRPMDMGVIALDREIFTQTAAWKLPAEYAVRALEPQEFYALCRHFQPAQGQVLFGLAPLWNQPRFPESVELDTQIAQITGRCHDTHYGELENRMPAQRVAAGIINDAKDDGRRVLMMQEGGKFRLRSFRHPISQNALLAVHFIKGFHDNTD